MKIKEIITKIKLLFIKKDKDYNTEFDIHSIIDESLVYASELKLYDNTWIPTIGNYVIVQSIEMKETDREKFVDYTTILSSNGIPYTLYLEDNITKVIIATNRAMYDYITNEYRDNIFIKSLEKALKAYRSYTESSKDNPYEMIVHPITILDNNEDFNATTDTNGLYAYQDFVKSSFIKKNDIIKNLFYKVYCIDSESDQYYIISNDHFKYQCKNQELQLEDNNIDTSEYLETLELDSFYDDDPYSEIDELL